MFLCFLLELYEFRQLFFFSILPGRNKPGHLSICYINAPYVFLTYFNEESKFYCKLVTKKGYQSFLFDLSAWFA